jgi:hypothetical protein
VLRIARGLLCGLVLVCAAGAASAATIQVTMTGTWSSVVDTAGVLDGSIVAGGAFTATFVYDDQVPDSEPFVGIGNYLMNGATGVLSFTTGNYSFIDQGTSNNGVGTEDSVQGVDIVGLFFDRFSAVGPFPVGVGIDPFGYANPTLTDYSETVLSSDLLTDIPWDASLWDTNFYFFGPITGRGAQDFIELDGTVTGMTVTTPEPGVVWLLIATGTALGLWRRRAR